jgi:hypothetical protein
MAACRQQVQILMAVWRHFFSLNRFKQPLQSAASCHVHTQLARSNNKSMPNGQFNLQRAVVPFWWAAQPFEDASQRLFLLKI